MNVLNGMRIRRFEDDGIVFAVFVFQDEADFDFAPDTELAWDQPLTSITSTVSNNADFTEEFISSIVTSVDGSEVSSSSFTQYDVNRSDTATAADLGNHVMDPRTGPYNGSAGGDRLSLIHISEPTRPY